MKELLTSILDTVKPNDSIQKPVKSMVKLLEKLGLHVVVGGSIAKQTYLKNDHDCDLFILFEETENLSDLLEKHLAKSKLPFTRIHGSRDYFETTYEEIHFELVPVHSIEKPEQALNVTDCSPLHVTWVLKHQKEVSGIPLYDHIRLAKAFCKAQRVYGAESYIGGFSGHVLDILIIHYGGFEQWLEHVAEWSSKEVIDTQQFYADSKTALKELNTSKIASALIVVDPIDKSRNAAAALTKEKFDRLQIVARNFLENPSESFFVYEPLSEKNWGANTGETIALTMQPIEGKKDVIGAKMKKAFDYLTKKIENYGFSVEKSEFWWDAKSSAICLWHIPKQTIGREYIHQGPPLQDKERVLAFKEKHSNTYEESGVIKTKLQREFTTIKPYLNSLLNSSYLTERSSSAQIKG